MKINNSKINYHHGTVSGNNICIGNSGTLDFDWKIRGGDKQEKREGYNILNNNSQFFPTLPGLTLDFKEDGSIVCQGTSSDTWNRKRNAGNIYNVESGTYTLYLKVVGSCPNAILNIALEDTDMKTIVSSRVGVSDSLLIKAGTFNYDGITEIKYTSILLEGIRTNTDYDCVFYPMLLKGTYAEDVKYEQFGASPSLEFPSEIETVKDSVKINAINKNFINMQKKTTSWSGAKVTVENNKITFVGASNGSLGLNFSSYESKIKMSKGNKITYSSKYVSGSHTSGNTYYNLKLIYQDGTFTTINMNRSISTYKNDISNTITLEKDVVAYQINGAGYTISGLTNELVYEFQLEIGDSASEIVEQSSQTVIMPIQQEMLTGDYIYDVEHHEWGKIESYNGEIITTDYISTTGELTTGATVYYKLAKPIDLELTSEQKAVRNQKLYTYKNITNISLSDELASMDVEYKKDLKTEHNKLQNEIDEIKQLISTTETSALLLDNLQKDVEMEVE